jgi:hypothetical protein
MNARRFLVAGVIGFVLWLVGLAFNPAEALIGWLFAWAAVGTVLIGMLLHVAASYLTRAIWFTVMRRLALPVISAIPVLIVLAIPIWLGLPHIYAWADLATASPAVRAAVAAKPSWLNPAAYIVRSVVYLAICAGIAEWFRRHLLAQDGADSDTIVRLTHQLRRGSAITAVVLGVVITFAAFDWLMSLDPGWKSTIYGAYIFAGGYLSALALSAVLVYLRGRVDPTVRFAVTETQRIKLGTLTFAFVMFWAYMAFSQFLIIWIADIPAEATWYVARGTGGWGAIALILLGGEFALPFVLLLARPIKRSPQALAIVGAWILLIHVLDIYWLVIPALHPGAIHLHWTDFTALIAVAGLVAATGAWRMRGISWIPLGDPDLDTAVTYGEHDPPIPRPVAPAGLVEP